MEVKKTFKSSSLLFSVFFCSLMGFAFGVAIWFTLILFLAALFKINLFIFPSFIFSIILGIIIACYSDKELRPYLKLILKFLSLFILKILFMFLLILALVLIIGLIALVYNLIIR